MSDSGFTFSEIQKNKVSPEMIAGPLPLQKVKPPKQKSTNNYLLDCITRKMLEIRTCPYMEIKHVGRVYSIAFSRCGSFVASGSEDKFVKVWNLLENKEEFCDDHEAEVFSVSFSPDSKLLASGSKDGKLKVWSIKNNKEKLSLSHEGIVWCVSFSPDGKSVASCDSETVKIWDLKGFPLFETRPSGEVFSVIFTPNGKYLGIGSKDTKVEVIDTRTYEKESFFIDPKRVSCICFSFNSLLLASGADDGSVKVWSISPNKLLFFRSHSSQVRSICFAPNNNLLSTASEDKTLKIWNIKKNQEEFSRIHSGKIFSLSFSFDSRFLASGSSDKTVIVWNVKENQVEFSENHSGTVACVCFSPDNCLLASGSWDKTVKIWNIREKQEEFIWNHSETVWSIVFSPDGRFLASGSEDCKAKVWNLKTKREELTVFHSKIVRAVCFDKTSNFLASGSEDGFVHVWNVQEKKEKFSVKHSAGVYSVCFSMNGEYLASGSLDKTAKIWNFDGKSVASVNHSGLVRSVAFSPDSALLISGSSDNTFVVFDIEKNRDLFCKNFNRTIRTVCFSPDGAFCAAGSEDSSVGVWNIKSRNEEFKGEHKKPVRSICFSPDGKYIASGSEDKMVKVWNFRENRIEFNEKHAGGVWVVCFSSDGRYLATGSESKTVKIWNFIEKREEFTGNHSGTVYSISFSSDCNYLASGSEDNTVKLWSIKAKQEEINSNGSGKILTVCFSPDNNLLASGSEDNKLKVWNFSENREILSKTHLGSVRSVDFSHDSQLLASGSFDNSVKVWDLITKQEKFRGRHSANVNCVCFNGKSSTFISSASDDMTARVWNIEEKAEKLCIQHSGKVLSVAFSSDGKFLASGSEDNTVKIYNIIDKKEEFNGVHAGTVWSVCFSPNCKFLASGSEDNSIKIWNMEKKSESFTGKHLGTVFTCSFSSNSNYLASGDEDCTVKIWNIKSKREEFRGKHSGSVRSVNFSNDCNFLASGADDKTVQIWNIHEKRSEFIESLSGPVNSVCFSPDCTFLASGSDEKRVKVWNIKERLNYLIEDCESKFLPSLQSDQLIEKTLENQSSTEITESLLISDHSSEVSSIFYSPDGNLLASGSRKVLIQNIKEKRIDFLLENLKNIKSVCISHDGKCLAFAEEENVQVWSIKENRSRLFQTCEKTINSVVFSPDDNFLATGSDDKTVIVWNINEKREEFVAFHENKVLEVLFSPDGIFLASGSADNTFSVWNIREKLEEFSGNHEDKVNSICFSFDGNLLATGSSDFTVKVWNYLEAKELFTGKHSKSVNSVTFSPNSTLLVSASNDCEVVVWDLKGTKVFQGSHTSEVNSVTFSPDNTLVASGSSDNSIKIWSLKEKKEILNGKHLNGVSVVSFSPHGNFLASASKDTTVKIWDIKSNLQKKNPIKNFTRFEQWPGLYHNEIDFHCFSFELNVVASGCTSDKSIKLKNLKQTKYLNHFKGNPRSMSINATGEYFAFELLNKGLVVWDIQNSSELSIFRYFKEVTCSCFLNQGLDLAVGSENSVFLVKIKDLAFKATLQIHEQAVLALSFSQDAQILASGSFDGQVLLWDFKEGKMKTLIKLNSCITSICISLDSKYIAYGAGNNSVHLFCISSEKEEFTLLDQNEEVISVSISKEGSLLASGSTDKFLQVWNFDSRKMIFKKNLKARIISVRFSPVENILVVGLSSGVAKVWVYEGNNELNIFLERDSKTNLNIEQISMIKDHDEDSDLPYKFSKGFTYKINELRQGELVKNPTFIETINQKLKNQLGFKVVLSSFGFEVLKKDQKVKNFKVISFKNSELQLEIASKILTFDLVEQLKLNPLYLDLLDYQKLKNCLINIDSDVISPNCLVLRPASVSDSFLYSPLTYFYALEAIQKGSFERLTAKHCNILISQYKYTVIHFASFTGHSKALDKLLNDEQEEVEIRADIFGKSPLFYSWMKKQLSCFETVLQYLVKMDGKDNYKVISSLHATRNDFLLIIESSSENLPGFLSKVLMKDDSDIKIAIPAKLPHHIISETINPKYEDFRSLINENKNSKFITGVLKFTAFAIPMEPYSEKNIEALRVLYGCNNRKVYDDVLVQYLIDYNWRSVFLWAFGYSFLIWIHILFYFLSFINPNNLSSLIPFWVTYSLILIWEMLHLGLDFKEYLKNSWNYIDILLICLSPCWSALRIYRIDSLYTDLALASLLMMRGIAPFKIFNGTRHYIRLILQSLNNIKYFLIIFLYLTMFFSVLIFIILRNDEQHDDTSFFDMVKMSWYLSATGNTDIQSKYVIISLVIFMSTILNLILMLNMLISNLGDSYDQFCFDKNIIDYRERISLTLEVQTALFWKNQVDKNHFVHILTRKFESKIEEDDDWQGRIMFTELKQEKRIESLEKIMNGLENKISLVDKKIETRFSAVDEKIDIICSQLSKSEIIQKK